ncbi:RNA polymerase II C-terminal domain phosphatase-like 4 [Miscanthus floridulus]|uniref:RNA polymerase II C-terminal domain phosphatase-like 4 n=1 Tax=Miscanthus floridulus TaxID=154761 RepID=UPI00345A7E89
MKQKQGGNDDDAPRCPPHPGFVGGLCFLCGEKEETERGAPGVAVGHETMKQGGDGDGNDDEARCVKEEDTEGGSPGAAVGHGMMKEEGDDHGNDDAPRCPPHPEFVLGLCYRCGATEEDAGGSASGITVANIDEAQVLPALAAATSIASPSDMATLKRERKLILVLDLDHTLLNSTRLQDLSAQEQRNGFTPYTGDELHMELFRLEYSDNVRMLVKLRPFVRGFLEQASSMFEMHVYTLGRQGYAKSVIDLLDPDGVYFGGRFVSRKESTQRDMKSLDVIPDADPAAVVILDDTDGAWPGHQDNLILMDRYHYFASTCRKFGYDIPSLAEQGRDEREQDCSLAVVLGVLERIHKAFFDGDRADVRDVIREVRRQVLSECTVVFSYLEEYMEDFPEDTLMRTLAERLGAACQKDVDETVTHVVAEDPGTQKAQWAREHGKFLVNPEWIKAVSFRWRRVDERGFPVTARES